MIEISRKRLEEIVKENWKEASPYTGEYHMGKADLANELLGNPEIDWDKHPRSLESMMKNSRVSDTSGIIDLKNPQSSTPTAKSTGSTEGTG